MGSDVEIGRSILMSKTTKCSTGLKTSGRKGCGVAGAPFRVNLGSSTHNIFYVDLKKLSICSPAPTRRLALFRVGKLLVPDLQRTAL